tara:strand:+ start:5021 stop:5401 length:381 start_codon:yes stop_codon:yes gene_type:complete
MWELQEQVNWMVEQYFEDSSAARISAEAVGLDGRAGTVFVSTEEEWIATSNVRSLEYYGGFEYVDSEYKVTVGDITFYSADDCRVAEAIAHYIELQEQQDEEEDVAEQQRRDEKNGLYPDKWDDAN